MSAAPSLKYLAEQAEKMPWEDRAPLIYRMAFQEAIQPEFFLELLATLEGLLLKASPHDPHKNRSNEGRWVTINAPRELVDRARAALAKALGGPA